MKNNAGLFNEMFIVPSLKKNQITGGALEEYKKLLDRLDVNTKMDKPKKCIDNIEKVSIWELSTALKWHYSTIKLKCNLSEFDGLIIGNQAQKFVRIEDVPKFLDILYKVMGE
jgi:hypothetical protein